MFKRGLVCSLVALAVLHTSADAFNLNGFLREEGRGDVALSYTFESYDEFWVGKQSGPTPPTLGEIETNSVSLWGAYGLNDRVTLFASLPHVDTEGDGTSNLSESGLQDLSLMAAYRFGTTGSDIRHQFVGAFGLRTPGSDYVSDAPIAIGDSTTDLLFRFVYLLQRGSFYFSQQIGLDARGEDAPDSYPLYTELGYTVGRATFTVSFDKLIVRDGFDIMGPGFSAAEFPNLREEYERIGARGFVRINDRIGISAGFFTTPDGRNTGEASGGTLGVNLSY